LRDSPVTFLASKLPPSSAPGEAHAVVAARRLHPRLRQPSDVPVDVVRVLISADDACVLGGRAQQRTRPDSRALVPRLINLVTGDRRPPGRPVVDDEQAELRLVDEGRGGNLREVEL